MKRFLLLLVMTVGLNFYSNAQPSYDERCINYACVSTDYSQNLYVTYDLCEVLTKKYYHTVYVWISIDGGSWILAGQTYGASSGNVAYGSETESYPCGSIESIRIGFSTGLIGSQPDGSFIVYPIVSLDFCKCID